MFQGDSGGPLHLLADDAHCTHTLVGVTAFGKFCGYAKSPGVYTRVSFFVPWIEDVVWAGEAPEEAPGEAPPVSVGADYDYDNDYDDYSSQCKGCRLCDIDFPTLIDFNYSLPSFKNCR